MKITGFVYYDLFDDMVVFNCRVRNVNKENVSQAKYIDGENFIYDCFRVIVNYDIEKDTFDYTDSDKYLTYIDTCGNNILFNDQINLKETIDKICDDLYSEFIENSLNNILVKDWFIFKKGTKDNEVINWFNEHHSTGFNWEEGEQSEYKEISINK